MGAFAGARADPASTAALARKIYDAHLRAGVFPEAVRFAKQLRYDGYKIVLVTSAPAFAAEPVAAQLGAGRVLGETLDIDAATGAFAETETSETSGASLEGGAYEAGERKSARVAAFAEEVGVNLNQSIAYGRLGASGLALMETVGKAYAVSPDDALRLEAEKRGGRRSRGRRTLAGARKPPPRVTSRPATWASPPRRRWRSRARAACLRTRRPRRGPCGTRTSTTRRTTAGRGERFCKKRGLMEKRAVIAVRGTNEYRSYQIGDVLVQVVTTFTSFAAT